MTALTMEVKLSSVSIMSEASFATSVPAIPWCLSGLLLVRELFELIASMVLSENFATESHENELNNDLK